MKKAILVVMVSLMGVNVLAAEKVSCLVNKFEGSVFNLSDDQTITFKGDLKSGEALLVDNSGFARVVPDTSAISKNNQLFQVAALSSLVIIGNVQSQTTAMGNRGVTITDTKEGISVTCGITE